MHALFGAVDKGVSRKPSGAAAVRVIGGCGVDRVSGEEGWWRGWHQQGGVLAEVLVEACTVSIRPLLVPILPQQDAVACAVRLAIRRPPVVIARRRAQRTLRVLRDDRAVVEDPPTRLHHISTVGPHVAVAVHLLHCESLLPACDRCEVSSARHAVGTCVRPVFHGAADRLE